MTLVSTAELVTAATATDSAVFAFNVITIEHAEAIADGVDRAGAAAVLQVSENAVRFHGGRMAPLLAACAQIATACPAPLALHLDHFRDVTLINDAIDNAPAFGVTSIMIDTAHLPYRTNVDATRLLVQRGHAAELWVEAELGEIGGQAGAHAVGARTGPDEAATFAAATGVDGLAVVVGSSPAMTTHEADLDIDLIDRLASNVAVPLVLQGFSGVPDELLRRAVRAGIRKVNVGTALDVAFTAAARQVVSDDPTLSDPRRYLAAGRRAITDTVAGLCGTLVREHTLR